MRRPRVRTYHSVAEINIANLVDVVLVLLIIFMISAPLLQSGIEINLPKTASAPPEQEREGIVITIDKKGGVYINDVFANMQNFDEKLKAELEGQTDQPVFIRGDSAIPYGVAISVIGRIKEMGIEQIGLVTGFAERSAQKRNGR